MHQLERVQKAMQDGEWHTLGALSKALDIGEACLSAHIRSLRKPKYGGWTVLRSHHEDASHNKCFHYKLLPPLPRKSRTVSTDVTMLALNFARDLALALVDKRLKEMRPR